LRKLRHELSDSGIRLEILLPERIKIKGIAPKLKAELGFYSPGKGLFPGIPVSYFLSG
jgi:hypothetical protein